MGSTKRLIGPTKMGSKFPKWDRKKIKHVKESNKRWNEQRGKPKQTTLAIKEDVWEITREPTPPFEITSPSLPSTVSFEFRHSDEEVDEKEPEGPEN